MVKVNAQVGKTVSLESPKNGNFWGKPEEWKAQTREERGPNTLDIKKKTIVKGV